jgi:hypothetical protein
MRAVQQNHGEDGEGRERGGTMKGNGAPATKCTIVTRSEARRAVVRALTGARRKEACHVLTRRGPTADLVEVPPRLLAARSQLPFSGQGTLNGIGDLDSRRFLNSLRCAGAAWL